MTTIEDALAKLPRIAWRGISFPIGDLSTSFSQDIASHKKPDLDGARQESTGRDFLVVSAKCHFRNGVIYEPRQSADPLYPNVHRAFLLACQDRTTGDLTHPEIGTFKAKCKSWSSKLAPTVRDGADVDVVWWETLDDTLQNALSTVSPYATADSSAAAVDAGTASLAASNAQFAALVNRTTGGASFADTVRSIRATTDTASLLLMQGTAQVTRVQAQLQTIRDGLDMLNTALANTTRQAIDRLSAALYEIKHTTLVRRVVSTFTTTDAVTVGLLAATLKNVPTDLIWLNPALLRSPVIPRDTQVRYYA